MDTASFSVAPSAPVDRQVFGHRLRHFRKGRGLTLRDLGAQVGKPPSYLSMLETGKREPRLSTLHELAGALGVEVADLLAGEAPDRRAELELALERAQDDPLYQELGLSRLSPSARVPDDVLEHLVTLFSEVRRLARPEVATSEEARQANAALRREMRERENYFADVEALAARALDGLDRRGGGALSQRALLDLCGSFGFSVRRVQDLPPSVRSVSDLRSRRIYIPQRDALGSEDARTVVLQTLGHFALEHRDPTDFAEFLRQRVEANYFAGAVLIPERLAVPFLTDAKRDQDLSVDDLQEVFHTSYEMAAHRFTNLATRHLGIPVHFLRSDESGTIWKAYENDGVRFPEDSQGAIEGQRLCRRWGTRQAFTSAEKFSAHHQYTDTPDGTFFCTTHVESGRSPLHAVTTGTSFRHARWFRGRLTSHRSQSLCPDGPCCQRPPADPRWTGAVWPSAKAHSHVLAALPAGGFPGVDFTDVYEFLDHHAEE
jgi:predicted transcriptional regulator/DNA-binding Xre family transcriptional regulator